MPRLSENNPLYISVYVLLESLEQFSRTPCTTPQCSAHEGTDTRMKKKELSWFHFPLEKPKIVVRKWMHNCGHAKNLMRHIHRQNVQRLLPKNRLERKTIEVYTSMVKPIGRIKLQLAFRFTLGLFNRILLDFHALALQRCMGGTRARKQSVYLASW